ncbi:MAG: restriction endonuclease, partial [Isosphaeraceae bacterium]
MKRGLERAIYTDEDPIPVTVSDLGELVASNPKGDVVTELKWENLLPKDFERLLFNLITDTSGYENPEWLTHTNAPDDGRDLSVYRVQSDKLSGVTRYRVIIACKHWTSKSVDLSEVSTLKGQMALWEPPRIDILILATSGRFTTQALHWIEKHNHSDSSLKIEMWPGTHFEWLLAQ